MVYKTRLMTCVVLFTRSWVRHQEGSFFFWVIPTLLFALARDYLLADLSTVGWHAASATLCSTS